MIATYQTRISTYQGTCREGGDAVLAAYAELYGLVQRKLFSGVGAGHASAAMKKAYLRRYWIPARMFNSIRVSLDGKIAAIRESMARRREGLKRNIARTHGQISRGTSRGGWQVAHQKRRKLHNLELRLSSLDADIAAGTVTASHPIDGAGAATLLPSRTRVAQGSSYLLLYGFPYLQSAESAK